jgi:FixJ family two-component response regulator
VSGRKPRVSLYRLLEITNTLLDVSSAVAFAQCKPFLKIALLDFRRDETLTDIVMPDMNGVELSKRLKAFLPDLKVVFISGYGGDDLARHISAAPGAALVEKPFSKRALLMRIYAVFHE